MEKYFVFIYKLYYLSITLKTKFIMQKLIQKISLGFSVLALPLLAVAGNKEISKTQLVPKDAISLIKSTKEISIKDISSLDFTGTYSGKRYQYTSDHKQILKIFTYTMNVIQSGTQISGTTNITSDNGDYAVIKLRGLVINNKMYFEEYEIQDQKKSDEMVWCFKVGELQLGTNKGNTIVYGPTNSYTSIYYFPCTGGYTVLEKEGMTRNTNIASKESNQLSTIVDNSSVEMVVFPNPFVNTINMNYTISKDSKVIIELFDINGKLLNTLNNSTQTSGDQSLQFDGSRLSSGVYVIKMNIDGVVTSKQLIKSSSN